MILLKIITKLGKEVTLSSERWNHIVARHPELAGMLEELGKAVSEPNIIIRSDEAYIYQRKNDSEYFTVVVDEKQTFIITAFISDAPKRGEIIWTN